MGQGEAVSWDVRVRVLGWIKFASMNVLTKIEVQECVYLCVCMCLCVERVVPICLGPNMWCDCSKRKHYSEYLAQGCDPLGFPFLIVYMIVLCLLLLDYRDSSTNAFVLI